MSEIKSSPSVFVEVLVMMITVKYVHFEAKASGFYIMEFYEQYEYGWTKNVLRSWNETFSATS